MDQMSIVDMEPVNLDDGAQWTFERSVSAAPGSSRTRFLGGVATAMSVFGGAHGGSETKVLKPSYLVYFETEQGRPEHPVRRVLASASRPPPAQEFGIPGSVVSAL